MFALLGRQIDEIDVRIKGVDAKLNAAHKANEISQRLVTIPGVGPTIALTLAVEIDPAMFESGRHPVGACYAPIRLARTTRGWQGCIALPR
jgi:transposase